MIRTVAVGAGAGAYEVLIGPRLLDRAGDRLAPLAPGGRIAVLTEPNVADHHGERLAAALEAGGLSVELLVGDVAPTLELGAGNLVAVFGGGRLAAQETRLAGPLASGAALVRIPTTLRSQVRCAGARDGRTRAVLADLDVLATLPPEATRAGYAEILRVALAADARLFNWLEAHGQCVRQLKAPELAHAVAACVEAHAAGRPGLDLGRAFADALHAQGVPEAEALSVGLALTFRLSVVLGLCSPDAAERATWNIAAAGLPVRLEELAEVEFTAASLAGGLKGDLTLARGIGEAAPGQALDPAVLDDFLVAEGAVP